MCIIQYDSLSYLCVCDSLAHIYICVCVCTIIYIYTLHLCIWCVCAIYLIFHHIHIIFISYLSSSYGFSWAPARHGTGIAIRPYHIWIRHLSGAAPWPGDAVWGVWGRGQHWNLGTGHIRPLGRDWQGELEWKIPKTYGNIWKILEHMEHGFKKGWTIMKNPCSNKPIGLGLLDLWWIWRGQAVGKTPISERVTHVMIQMNPARHRTDRTSPF